MTVICINDKQWMEQKSIFFIKFWRKVNGPKFMEECAVSDDLINKYGPAYRFEEYGMDKYPKKFFIPLSGIDEVELANKRNKTNA